jgi:hypothetical protein
MIKKSWRQESSVIMAVSFCKRQRWKPTWELIQMDVYFFNSKTNVVPIFIVMKPNIDLFNSGYCRNEMLKPLTDKGFICFLL